MPPLHRSFLALCLFGLSTSVAFGDSFESGVYAGAQLGYGNYHTTHNSEDDRRFIGGLSLGYSITPYLATELNYQHLGKSSVVLNDDQVSLDIDQVALLGKLSYPITPKLEPYLKLGISNWFGKENGRSTDGRSVVIAGGLQYTLNPKLKLGVTYQHIDSISDSNDIGHNGVFIEAKYQFGQNSRTPLDIAIERPIHSVEPKVEKQVAVEAISETSFSVTFGFDSTEIANTAALNKLVDILKANDSLKAHIYGYASPIGNKAYNNVLSQKRSDAVKAYLIAQDITADRLVSIGKGEYSSAVSPVSYGQRADVLIKIE